MDSSDDEESSEFQIPPKRSKTGPGRKSLSKSMAEPIPMKMYGRNNLGDKIKRLKKVLEDSPTDLQSLLSSDISSAPSFTSILLLTPAPDNESSSCNGTSDFPEEQSNGSMGLKAKEAKSKPVKCNERKENSYKHVRLTDKREPSGKFCESINAYNTSDEEDECSDNEDFDEVLALFFKKLTRHRISLDKLHNSLFKDSLVSDNETGPDSDNETDDVEFSTEVVNCPGPSKFEAKIGQDGNAKLSVVQTNERKVIKSLCHQVYKVVVSSEAGETFTDILVPIKFDGSTINGSQESRKIPFSHIPHKGYNPLNSAPAEVLEELTKTQLKIRKYKAEMKALRKMYVELLTEYAVRPQYSTVSDLIGAASKFLTEDQLVLFLMQIKKGASSTQGIRYSIRERILALAVYQKCPGTYDELRPLLNLPSKTLLNQWLEDIGEQDPELLKKLMYHTYVSYETSPS